MPHVCRLHGGSAPQVRDAASTRLPQLSRCSSRTAASTDATTASLLMPLLVPVPCSSPRIVKRTLVDSFVMLHPRTLAKNPVMFVVEVRAAACWSETARLWVPG